MTYKQIEGARELRLWIGQIIVPAVTAGIILYSNPNVRNLICIKYNELKNKIIMKRKFRVFNGEKES